MKKLDYSSRGVAGLLGILVISMSTYSYAAYPSIPPLSEKPAISVASFTLPSGRDEAKVLRYVYNGAEYKWPYMLKHIKNINDYGCRNANISALGIQFDVQNDVNFLQPLYGGRHWAVALRNNVDAIAQTIVQITPAYDNGLQVIGTWEFANGQPIPNQYNGTRVTTGNGVAVGDLPVGFGIAAEWFDKKYEAPGGNSVDTNNTYYALNRNDAPATYRYHIVTFKAKAGYRPSDWQTDNLVTFTVHKQNVWGFWESLYKDVNGNELTKISWDQNPLIENGGDISFSAIDMAPTVSNGSYSIMNAQPMIFSNITAGWSC